jgi:hypothetical protein
MFATCASGWSLTSAQALALTCRTFRAIVRDMLFRYVFLPTPRWLPVLAEQLEAHPSLALRTRRVHLFSAPTDVTSAALLRRVIRHCRNLEIVVVEGALPRDVFSAVADSLRKSLRAMQFTISTDSLSTLIWTLSSLSHLVAMSVTFNRTAKAWNPSTPTAGSELDAPLGAASNLRLELPNLEQLVVSGPCAPFIEQAAGWTMPRLTSLTVDAAEREDLPDLVEFLAAHGEHIEYLDVDGLEPFDMPALLAACPLLSTLVFNPDWRLTLPGSEDDPRAASVLTAAPHGAITRIGLRGLHDALGASTLPAESRADAVMPTAAQIHVALRRRANDANFRALTRTSFPNLRVVRAVSRPLLAALERMNGPGDEPGCFERWERWWEQCARTGVRLEDCTGDFLGTLPERDAEEDEYSDDEDDVSTEDGSYSESSAEGDSMRDELRQLLMECQHMNATRETAPSPLLAMLGQMGISSGTGVNRARTPLLMH